MRAVCQNLCFDTPPCRMQGQFSQTVSHILKQIYTSSSEQRLDEGRDGFTIGASGEFLAGNAHDLTHVFRRGGSDLGNDGFHLGLCASRYRGALGTFTHQIMPMSGEPRIIDVLENNPNTQLNHEIVNEVFGFAADAA